MRNSAENETWGNCVGERPLCDEFGLVNAIPEPYLCTGGFHVAPGHYIRCTSDFHDQPGPMSPGIGVTATPTVTLEVGPEWDAMNRRPARELPGLRRLMDRPSPFSEGRL